MLKSDKKSVRLRDNFRMTGFKAQSFPHPKSGGPIHYSGRWEYIHQAGFKSGLPAAQARPRIEEVRCN